MGADLDRGIFFLELEIRRFWLSKSDLEFVHAARQRIRDGIGCRLQKSKKFAIRNAVRAENAKGAAEGLMDAVRDDDHRASGSFRRELFEIFADPTGRAAFFDGSIQQIA